MVDSLARIYADATSKAGKAADDGSLTKQQWTKAASELNCEAKANLSKRQIYSKTEEQKKSLRQVKELVDESGF